MLPLASHRTLPLVLLVLLTGAPLWAQSARINLNRDDIVLNVFGQTTRSIDVFAADGSPRVQFGNGTGSFWEGASILPDGRLVTTRRQATGINVFDTSGLEVLTFDTPEVGNLPGDVSAFADGTMAVSNQNGASIELFDLSGAHVGSWTAPSMTMPFGNYVDPDDDTLWVAVSDTAAPTVGAILQFDRSGTLLNDIPTGWQVGDLIVAPDGTLWVTDRLNDHVRQLDQQGTELTSFPLPTSGGGAAGIGMSSDGTLVVVSNTASYIYRYDTSGTLLASYPAAQFGIPVFLTVVTTPSLIGVPATISVGLGGYQVLFTDMGPALAGMAYLALGSASGTDPGIPFGGLTLPLNWDSYLGFTLANPNKPPLTASAGVLNSEGQAVTVFSLSAGSDPSLVGITLSHACAILDFQALPPAVVEFTEAVDLKLLP
jgi:streptogramin lyase